MEKIRIAAVSVLLIMTMAVMTACQRKNDRVTTPDPGNTTAETTMESRTAGTNQPSTSPRTDGESGGVLRDMVDDVGDGLENLTDDVTGMSGTTAAGTKSQATETTKAD